MAADLTIGQSQTLPVFAVTIIDPTTTVAANLTGGSVKFVMRAKGTSVATVNAAATIITPASGTVQYAWAAADTATPGFYVAQFLVTTSGGGTYTYPQTGYLEVEVQESLSGAPQRLVEIADVKDVLNLQNIDRAHDTKILRWIDAARPVIEAITGPIVLTTYDEWYDGAQYHLVLRHPPSTGYGTSPVCNLAACSIYIGPIEYVCSIVQSPDFGQVYSVMIDSDYRLVRRGPGGGMIPFPNSLQSVHVVYQAGQSTVPANVYEGTLEYLRENYQATAQALRKASTTSASEVQAPPVGYAVSYRVRQILAPTRKAPAVW